MGGEYGTYGKRRFVSRVWWENLRERKNSKDPRVAGRIILRWIFRKWGVGQRLN
jgi:hypothetical protein